MHDIGRVVGSMRAIQIAVADRGLVAKLSKKLEQSGAADVVCVDVPDVERGGVLLLDVSALRRVPRPLANPERVVLIAPEDEAELSRAFDAGIKSVVTARDDLDTILLAVMAADLRVSRTAAAAKWCPGTGREAG